MPARSSTFAPPGPSAGSPPRSPPCPPLTLLVPNTCLHICLLLSFSLLAVLQLPPLLHLPRAFPIRSSPLHVFPTHPTSVPPSQPPLFLRLLPHTSCSFSAFACRLPCYKTPALSALVLRSIHLSILPHSVHPSMPPTHRSFPGLLPCLLALSPTPTFSRPLRAFGERADSPFPDLCLLGPGGAPGLVAFGVTAGITPLKKFASEKRWRRRTAPCGF